MDHGQHLAASNGAAITRAIFAMLPKWVMWTFAAVVAACVVAALVAKVRRRYRT
ncbi:hypothetical protein ACIRNI_17430 [Streptomyces sp. NPDC093546]|uniref:hypothetical protein n=1 Tax=Streptomyces sp. NPDC093546 TaxID=3366040 RepID=UPI003817E8FF